MRRRGILSKVFLVLGFFALFMLIKYQNQIKDLSSLNSKKLKVYLDNFSYRLGLGRERKRPISTLEAETELKLYIGEPFRSFQKEDWNEFWDIIYGVQAEESPEEEGFPPKVKQLTMDEIAFELMSRYPQPFAYFTEKHWELFFGIIFKK